MKSRQVMVPAKRYYWFCLVILFFISIPVGANPYTPVYIEDSHAGSYYFFVENLDLSKKYQLILFDRHSDATEAFDSDAIREKAIESKNDYSLDQLFQSWRKRGIIQCFNWIEPLMPKPFSKVIWVAGDTLVQKEQKAKQVEVDEQINCHEEAIQRDCGNLTSSFTVTDFTRLQKLKDFNLPIVVSIDLDYFTGLNDSELNRELNRVLKYTFSLPNVQAISFAISYPYLQSPKEADQLLYMTFKYLQNIVNIDFHYEPFLDNGPDRSELAKSYYKKRQEVPKYDIRNASSSLKSLLLNLRLKVEYEHEEWQNLLSKWRNRLKCNPYVTLYKNHQKIPKEHFNYFSITDEMGLRIEGIEALSAPNISWKVLCPQEKSINLTGQNYGFADNATKWIFFEGKNIINKDTELKSDDLINLFDPKTGFGTVRLFAEITDKENIYQSDIICLSRYKDQSYLGKLTEIFNLPYILGSCLIKEDQNIGADVKYGADCSNFIIYGKRRLGFNIPYHNPNQLKRYLIELDSVSGFVNGEARGKNGKVLLNDEMINEGLLLHFGGHIVAVYQDNVPKNVLDSNDLIIHQLENFPEIIALKDLKQAKYPFKVMKFK